MNTRQLSAVRTATTPTMSFTPMRSGLLQRKCACGNHTFAGGECAECAKKKSGLQRKLIIGASNDPLEQEADRVADQVMAAPTHSAVSRAPPRIQRYAGQATKGTETAPASVDRVLASSGRPLEPALQQDMELRFGHDFSKVRVHTGGAAKQSAREVNANAYTAGHNIVFGADRFAPGTCEGRRLLAHELTHVVQQGGSELNATIQADFALEPSVAAPIAARLTAAEIATAVAYNQLKVTLPDEISLLRDILGLSRTPADVDDDFVLAVVRYQASYGLTQDGKLGPATVTQLSKEVIAEGTFLGAGNRGSLELEYSLRNDVQALIDAGNTTYADYKTKIQAATVVQRNVALLHEDLLTNIQGALTWNNFARCVELLGRQASTYWQLIGEAVVRTAVRAAWNDSDVAVPAVGTTQHEEGGWVFLNLITGALTTRRAARGAGASISLAAPPTVTDSIMIAEFHTHPNLGPGWRAGPSPGDATSDAADGVPDIIAGTTGVDPARFDLFPSGPDRREHLAGNRGIPGAAGGLAPQAKRDGTYDER